MKEFIKKYWLILVAIFGLLIIICFALLFISESQMPTFRSVLIAIISAFLGVLMTVAVTAILLEKQAETQKELLKEQSETESQKDKNIKIYEQKIRVYSEFIKEMWDSFDGNVISNDKLIELRKICFNKLVFHLDKEQINKICAEIDNIDDSGLKAVGEITTILKNSIKEKKEKDIDKNDLLNLFKVFNKNENTNKKVPLTEESFEKIETNIQQEKTQIIENKVIEHSINNITFWHFNTWSNQQIEAFEKGNWVLNLIEYGEEWRTNALKQVQPDDVVFLFRRGGSGYIGAFRVKEKVILTDEKYENEEYSDEEIQKYDMYGALEDGATYSSNLIVEPIAYNYHGVGYYSVRRRTIERINDLDAVWFLINKFDGNELTDEQKASIGKLDKNKEIMNINKEYFNKIAEQIL